MTQTGTDKAADVIRKNRGALTRYRVMAFTTGTVLLTGTILLILKYSDVEHMKTLNAVVWIAHGYLYIVYLITTAQLGFKLKWPITRMLLVGLAGTIPTMSFVAEHYVTRDARASGAV